MSDPTARCAALTFHTIDVRESVLALSPSSIQAMLVRVCEAGTVSPLETLASRACAGNRVRQYGYPMLN